MAELHGTDSMGETAENVAERYGVSREDQDAFALESHRRAVAAAEAGRFDDELVTVDAPQPKGEPITVHADEGPAPRHHARAPGRPAAGLPRGRHGDRRQLVADQRRRRLPVLASEERASELGRRAARAHRRQRRRGRRARATWASARSRPRAWRSSAPASTIDDIDLVELNEAFASQVLRLRRASSASTTTS